jgi:hypothetical protein
MSIEELNSYVQIILVINHKNFGKEKVFKIDFKKCNIQELGENTVLDHQIKFINND